MQENKLVITFDQESQTFGKEVEGTIPMDKLVNFLEVIKTDLVLKQLAAIQQQLAREAQKKLVVPGGPIPNLRH